MRGLISILGVFGGLGLIAYGTGVALGWFDGSGAVPSIIGGVLALVIGVLLLRAMGTDHEDVGPFPQAPDPEDIPTSGPAMLDTDAGFGQFESQPSPDTSTPRPVTTGPTERGNRGVLVRIIAFAVIAAFATGGGARVFDAVSDLFGDDAPNVPVHVLDACNEARRAAEGAAASYGTAYAYEQTLDGASEVRFRTSQGFEWDCRWDPADFVAEVTDTRQPD